MDHSLTRVTRPDPIASVSIAKHAEFGSYTRGLLFLRSIEPLRAGQFTSSTTFLSLHTGINDTYVGEKGAVEPTLLTVMASGMSSRVVKYKRKAGLLRRVPLASARACWRGLACDARVGSDWSPGSVTNHYQRSRHPAQKSVCVRRVADLSCRRRVRRRLYARVRATHVRHRVANVEKRLR